MPMTRRYLTYVNGRAIAIRKFEVASRFMVDSITSGMEVGKVHIMKMKINEVRLGLSNKGLTKNILVSGRTLRNALELAYIIAILP